MDFPKGIWLNCGIEGQVNWPSKNMEVEFDGHKLVLMPRTRSNSASVHIETTGISDVEAMTLVNRFLSTICWKDDEPIINHYGWSGNLIPVAVPRKNTQFGYSPTNFYPNKIESVSDKKQQLALALYREGRSLNSVPYRFLSFFKILNIFWKDKYRNGRNELIEGLKKNLLYIKDKDVLERMTDISSQGHDVAEYLYKSGRCAIAHAYSDPIVDPDDVSDLHRLSSDLWLIRAVASFLIETKLKIPKSIWA